MSSTITSFADPPQPVRSTNSVSKYPWWFQLAEKPLPEPLPQREWAVLPLRFQPGLAELEALLHDGVAVGPILCCPRHRWLYVPVPPECRRSPVGERLGVRGQDLSCPFDTRHRAGCDERLWLLPADPRYLTDFPALAERMYRVRRSAPTRLAAACA
ncbi:hypothetical protein HOK021_65080 [Streptomyces hygroscopicus]|nr:hypothetical protein HOK021_65080 [Streptomyces hygroscopicus]